MRTSRDPAALDDDMLIRAMGTHSDDCPCPDCVEWERRRQA